MFSSKQVKASFHNKNFTLLCYTSKQNFKWKNQKKLSKVQVKTCIFGEGNLSTCKQLAIFWHAVLSKMLQCKKGSATI
jgi:hypothetical protein